MDSGLFPLHHVIFGKIDWVWWTHTTSNNQIQMLLVLRSWLPTLSSPFSLHPLPFFIYFLSLLFFHYTSSTCSRKNPQIQLLLDISKTEILLTDHYNANVPSPPSPLPTLTPPPLLPSFPVMFKSDCKR